MNEIDQRFYLERFDDEIQGAGFSHPPAIVTRRPGGNDDDGDIVSVGILFELLHHAKTVQGVGRAALERGLAYVPEYALACGLSVWDLRDPARPRRLGRYAAPDERYNDLALAPLADGRLLWGRARLHLLAPPKLGE